MTNTDWGKKQFESNVSLCGNGYQRYINLLLTYNNYNKIFRSKLFIFLGLVRLNKQQRAQLMKNDKTRKNNYHCCRPFVLRNLFSLRDCCNCHCKSRKLKGCCINGQKLLFCSQKCQFLGAINYC